MTDVRVRKTRLDGLRLVFGDEKCVMCDHEFPGQRIGFGSKPCDKCKGTGRRGSGKCRNCADWWDDKGYRRAEELLPQGHVRDYEQPFPDGACGACGGTRCVAANYTTSLSGDVLAAVLDVVPVRVALRGGEMGRVEQALGYVGGDLLAVWSVTDYGRTFQRLGKAGGPGERDAAWRARVEAEIEAFRLEIVEKLKADRIQACKLATRDGVLVSEIVISLASNGYSVIGVPRGEGERAAIVGTETGVQ